MVYCGNVGTGFTEKSLTEMNTLLQKYSTTAMPFKTKPPGSTTAKWVTPHIVVEIEFSEWTVENSLRHPSFKGIRTDKPAKKIIHEQTLSTAKVEKK